MIVCLNCHVVTSTICYSEQLMTLGSFSAALKMQIFLLFSINVINKSSYVFLCKKTQLPSRKVLKFFSLICQKTDITLEDGNITRSNKACWVRLGLSQAIYLTVTDKINVKDFC